MTSSENERRSLGDAQKAADLPTLTPARILALGPQIRYAAIVSGSEIRMEVREGLTAGSAAESDFYEELLVNPTILGITGRRGGLDCGGLRFVVVGYGMFNQVVVPNAVGHVSVAVELTADAFAVAEQVVGLLSPPADVASPR